MASKPSKPKLKKISISLTEREAGLLQLFASDHNLTKGRALKRLMKQGLRDYESQKEKSLPRNQLGLFDAVQTDIFNAPDEE